MSSTSTTRLTNTSLKKEVGKASREQVDEFIPRIILRSSALLILEKDVRDPRELTVWLIWLLGLLKMAALILIILLLKKGKLVTF